ncbi:hypothetical protein ABZ848_00610 [Streptomyces sp. NPDC047081]|uniref:hypothetical protein n=1 Tax=Streptomyces sp. NPDC047081 TaxID=3154706 RepID=UPI0033D9A44D
MRNKTIWPVLGAAVLLAGACSGNQAHQGDCVHAVDENTGRTAASCLPLAPKSARVDLATPRFTHPTRITNPLHPTARVTQTIYGGQESGKPFRTEVTLLPGTRTITWGDRTIHAVTSQYVAFSAGRVEEVADDWYAQADDGSVWYLGENVFNYDNGVVADTEGTWQAGHGNAPGAMIMPAHPHKGDVYRTENLPGVVFEQVTVRGVGQTVDGPYGKITDAMTVHELHMDGTTEDKVFAPGYGEFSTGSPAGDLEAVSLAVPTDAKHAPVPPGLAALKEAVRAAHATPTPAKVSAAQAAWDGYRAADAVPPLLQRQMTRDLNAWQKSPADRAAALRTEQNMTDLRLRYEPLATVDLARLTLWARQLEIDAKAGDAGSVAGDVTCLELIGQRGDTPKSAAFTADLKKAREAADRKDTGAAASSARELQADIGSGH